MADKKKRSGLYHQIFIGIGVALVATLPAVYEIKNKPNEINEEKRSAYEEKSLRVFWSFFRAIRRDNKATVNANDIKVEISVFLADADADGDGYIIQGEFHEALHRYYLK